MAERIGVFVCECGPNIAENVDIDELLEAASAMKDVALAERHKLLCSPDGQKFLAEKIAGLHLTRLVVAACSPRQHEPTFMGVCEGAGMNPYFLQMANIREHCAWIIEDKAQATDKALRHLRAAIARVAHHAPLEKRQIDCNGDVLIIGGGVAGMRTALLTASGEREVYLVERAPALGGAVAQFEKLFPTLASGPEFVQKMIDKIRANSHIHVLTESEPIEVVGFFGNFIVTVRRKDATCLDLEVGAVVLATGFELLGPQELESYGYGTIADVYTSLEFERMNATGRVVCSNGKAPESVAVVHCVCRGEKGYCSAVCCAYSMKFAHYLSEKVPRASVTAFCSDLCLPGGVKGASLDAVEKPVELIRGSVTRIEANGEQARASYVAEGGSEESRCFDMVVLSPPMVAAHDTERIAEMLNIPLGKQGFFAEEHEKLSPVATSLEGVFIAGCAQGPKGIEESITQAEAVAGRILSSLVPGRKLETEAKTSEISQVLCKGCRTCLNVCTYGAISFEEIKGICVVNEVLCRGCGNCAAACPSGAARVKHFTPRQIAREVAGVLK